MPHFRIMKAQTLGDTSQMEFMRGRRILEINPKHPIIQDLNVYWTFPPIGLQFYFHHCIILLLVSFDAVLICEICKLEYDANHLIGIKGRYWTCTVCTPFGSAVCLQRYSKKCTCSGNGWPSLRDCSAIQWFHGKHSLYFFLDVILDG